MPHGVANAKQLAETMQASFLKLIARRYGGDYQRARVATKQRPSIMDLFARGTRGRRSTRLAEAFTKRRP